MGASEARTLDTNGATPVIGRRTRIGLAILIVFFACTGFAAQAQAATYTVGTTSDTTGTCTNPAGAQCSLRQLIDYENALPAAPNPPDTIIVPAGSYALGSGVLTISRGMSIVGAGAGRTSVDQYSQTPDRVFDVQATASPVTISGLAIEFGTANSNNGDFGGNVRNQGILTLSEDSITGGLTQGGSGAGVSNDAGTLTVARSLISGNGDSNTNDSGGIQNFGSSSQPGNLTVIDSTISGNTSAQGGGIFSWCFSTPCTNTTTVVNSTIVHNDGGNRNAGGGGILEGAAQGTMTVQNSIVAFNTVDTPNSGTPSNCGGSGTISSGGYNIENGSDCGFTSTGDRQNTDPGFTSSSLEDWGGNTETFGFDARSPAVDAIPPGAPNCGGTDQRDIDRPQGQGCDIGAFELFQPIEGRQASIQVSADGCGVIGPATINWGDGTSSQSQPDTLVGTHTYAHARTYDGTVTYQNDCATHTNVPFDLKVQNAVAAAGAPITATAGSPFTGKVASFTDATPGRGPADFAAAINWGDGSTSAGTITGSAGSFAVSGAHTYSTPGTYATTINISDVGGATATATGTASVSIRPVAVTGKPSVSSDGAVFSASVNPEGSPTTVQWQYGVDAADRGPGFTGTALDQATTSQSIGSGFAGRPVSATASHLLPDTLYDVRIVARNSAGTTFGSTQAFTTPKALVSAVPPPGTENFTPIGKLYVLVNGQFVKLTGTVQLPSGTVVDALQGSLTLVSSSLGGGQATDAKAKKGKKPKKPKTYTGTFTGGVFKVTQTTAGPHKGLTTLTLMDRTRAIKGSPSYATTCKAHSAGDPSATTAHVYRLYSVSGRARGRYSTRGRYGAGTVRGTAWTVTDRCDGTLISVQVHAVEVTDFVKHRTILITAGHHYLAKAPTPGKKK